ncbi:MAG: hypothetical protein Q8P68_03625 [Candidatus Peregrinibacteria bacterium]|nr:hypothetical protein [Candidatus Peregrinibacteria bacterium]
MEYVTLLALLGLIGFIVWDKTKAKIEDVNLKQEFEDKYREKMTDLEVSLKKAESERDELSGKGKEMFVHLTSLKEKSQTLDEKLQETAKKLTRFESEEEARTKEFSKKVTDLEEARKALEDEKVRIRREDIERMEDEERERDRIWNEHENACLSAMKEVCQKPELGFAFYGNTTLPDSFDGGLKPDFLVEFLGQYIIFDAKMSRSASLQNYLNDQVKKTVKKIKGSKNEEEIYNTVFFIVPTIEFDNLKKTHFYEEGYSFFALPIEAFEAILSSFKRVMNYDLAESFDPKERENIVNLIATYDQHISRQNAINLLTTVEGLKVMHQKGTLSNDIRGDIETTKKKMRVENLKPNDLKRFIQNPEEQIKQIKGLVEPKEPEVATEDLVNVQSSLLD